MSTAQSFSEILSTLMKDKGITQSELAEKCQITRQSVSYYKCGTSEPTASVLASIAKALKVPSDYLLGLSDVESYDETTQAVSRATGLSARSTRVLLHQRSIAGESLDSSSLHALDRLMQQRDFWVYLNALAKLFEYGEMAKRIVEGERAADVCEGSTFLNSMYEDGRIDPFFENSQIIEELMSKFKESVLNATVSTEFFHSLPVRANTLCNDLEKTKIAIATDEEHLMDEEAKKHLPLDEEFSDELLLDNIDFE